MMALRLPTPERLRAVPWRPYLWALFWLPWVDLRLRRKGYAATRAWLARRFPARPGAALAQPQVLDWARAVSLAARYTPWPTSCLRQALLLHAVLTRGGQPAELRIGVALDPNEGFGAHAWVCWGGRVLIGGEHASRRYTRIL
jgi:hypothetical protein